MAGDFLPPQIEYAVDLGIALLQSPDDPVYASNGPTLFVVEKVQKETLGGNEDVMMLSLREVKR